ncbi:hypothetical protein M378DRAFT_16796 [Amanita muscaria Koide BX008]|uniref:Uncharacterized protein n=1 Tax=Amanita muscaria (strain Koide BX008) TaxID=946122 RepID=A0A0C2W6K1_AMAMK|nr:hypothetical protein M378DRAFT_16796 [Amanita muscaria Koide BX008]
MDGTEHRRLTHKFDRCNFEPPLLVRLRSQYHTGMRALILIWLTQRFDHVVEADVFGADSDVWVVDRLKAEIFQVDVLKADVLKTDVLKADLLEPDVFKVCVLQLRADDLKKTALDSRLIASLKDKLDCSEAANIVPSLFYAFQNGS